MWSACYVPSFNFSHGAVSEIQRSKVFPFFPIWLLHHVTYDVIIIKTFYMSSRSYCENFVSIRQAVADKNTKVLCEQTNRQTDPNPKPSPLVSVKILATISVALLTVFEQQNVSMGFSTHNAIRRHHIGRQAKQPRKR